MVNWAFLVPKSTLSKSSLNCLTDFSEVVFDNRHLKEDKREGFGFLKKIVIILKGANEAFLGWK